MAAWSVVPSPDPDNSQEVGSIAAAAAAAAPGDIITVVGGSWGGAATFKSGVSLIGAGRNNTVLSGIVNFAPGSAKSLVTNMTFLGAFTAATPVSLVEANFAGVVSLLQGGDIIKCLFPPKSKLNYLGGTGIFKDSLIDSDFFIGAAIVTGDNVQSTGLVGADYESAPGANMTLSGSTFGGMAVSGLGVLSLGASQSYTQTGGVSGVSNYAIKEAVIIESGQSVFENTTIGEGMIIKGGGSAIIKMAVTIG